MGKGECDIAKGSNEQSQVCRPALVGATGIIIVLKNKLQIFFFGYFLRLTNAADNSIRIGNSRADVHFISFSSLVILGSGRRISYQLLLLSSSINYKSSVAPGRTFIEYPAFSNTCSLAATKQLTKQRSLQFPCQHIKQSL